MRDTAVSEHTEGKAESMIHLPAEPPLVDSREAEPLLCPTDSSHCLVKGKLVAAAFRECTNEVSVFACGIAAVSISFLFMGEKYSIVWIYHNLFNQSPRVGGHLAIAQKHC